MQTQRIEIDRKQARELYREYKAHQHWSEPIDHEIQRTYQLIAQGRVVIRALDSIKAAGLDAAGNPKLAIVRANAAECWCELWMAGRVQFRSKRWNNYRDKRGQIELPDGTFPPRTNHRELRAIVPIIPLHLRPKRGLANYHILWEADWKQVPVDPLLLRRIGKGDLWLVVAAWDLTEVERAALAARVSA